MVTDEEAEKLAEVMAEALSLCMKLAADRGYCPGCFMPAFGHAILQYAECVGFPHDENLKTIAVVPDEDAIGDVAGTA